jgi:hypothetical protein
MTRSEHEDEPVHEPEATGSQYDDAPWPELWAVPDEFAEGAARWANRIVKSWSVELHPLLGEIGHEKASDLPSEADLADTDAGLATSLYRPIHVQVATTLDLDEVLRFDVPATLGRLFEMADEWGGQRMRGLLGHISDVSEEYGQTVDASGRDFGDVLIEALERLEITFDENDNPVMPTLVMHPDLAAKMEGTSPTPEQECRIAEIIERKREEHRASQRRPDLP